MAKSIDLLLILFGSFICLYTGNNGVYVSSNTLEKNTRIRDQHADDQINKNKANLESNVRKQLQKIYLKEIGVREKTYKNDGERIADYLRYTDLPEGYAWCASFVSWSFGQVGFKEPQTAWSPSLFPNRRIIWKRDGGIVKRPQANNIKTGNTEAGAQTKLLPMQGEVNIKTVSTEAGAIRTNGPAPGDVFGIYFNNLKRIAHAGFVDEWGDKYVITVEGNTNDGGSREGDGVYRKRRPISSIYQVANWITD